MQFSAPHPRRLYSTISPKDGDTINVKSFTSYLKKYHALFKQYEHHHRVVEAPMSDSAVQKEMERCFQTVPSIFFDPDFDLRNPRTYRLAFGTARSEDVETQPSNESAPKRDTNPSGSKKSPKRGTNPFGSKKSPKRGTNPFGSKKSPKRGTNPFGSKKSPKRGTNPFGSKKSPKRNTNPFGREEQDGGANSTPSASSQAPDNAGGETADNLPGYLESVEMSLLTLVSSRSDSFFSQLQNLQDFKQQVSSCCMQTRDLRMQLKSLRSRMTEKALNVSFSQRRLDNSRRLQEKLKLMVHVLGTQKKVLDMLEVCDYCGALDCIKHSRNLLRTELVGVHGLKHLGRQLAEFENAIASQMASQFLTKAVSLELVEDEDEDEQVARRVTFKETLLPLVRGLMRVGALRKVMHKYRKRLTEVVLNVVRTAVSAALDTPSGDSARDDAKSTTSKQQANVITQLKSLDAKNFVSMLSLVLSHLLGVMSRAATVHELLLVVLADVRHEDEDDVADNRNAAVLKKRDHAMESCKRDSREALEHMWRSAQKHVKKMFEVRVDEHAALSLTAHKTQLNVIVDFVKVGEKKCGQRGDVLLDMMASQTKRFLDRLHSDQTRKLKTALENECWTPVQVPSSYQSIAIRIQHYADGSEQEAASRSTGDTQTSKSLELDGKTYHVVSAALTLLKILGKHITTAQIFGTHVPTLLGHTVSALRIFNDRTNELILGTGALKSSTFQRVGGGKIMALHLALVSQCLSLFMSVIPKLRAALAALMTVRQQQLLADLDELKVTYEAHQQQIFDKFVEITDQMVAGYCRQIAEIDWETDNGEGPNKYMVDLVRQTSKLHRQLISLLPSSEVQEIFAKIVKKVLNKKIPVYFEKMSSASLSTAAVQRILDDIAHLVSSLRNVRGLRDRGRTLDRHFRDRFMLGLS